MCLTSLCDHRSTRHNQCGSGSDCVASISPHSSRSHGQDHGACCLIYCFFNQMRFTGDLAAVQMTLNFETANSVITQFQATAEGMLSTSVSIVNAGTSRVAASTISAPATVLNATTSPHHLSTVASAGNERRAITPPAAQGGAGAATTSASQQHVLTTTVTTADAMTNRSRSVGSHLGMSVAGSSPRSLTSCRVGQAGFSMGLAVLREAHTGSIVSECC